MNQKASKQIRILALAPTARGFGYSVMEDRMFLENGYKTVRGDKNLHSVSKVEKLMRQFLPNVVVLQDVNANGSHRAPRIKVLHHKVVELVESRRCQVTLFSGRTLRRKLLHDVKGTKQEMAEALAKQYPSQLGAKLPPKRRSWDSEDGRMDMFDAVGLAVVFWAGKEP